MQFKIYLLYRQTIPINSDIIYNHTVNDVGNISIKWLFVDVRKNLILFVCYSKIRDAVAHFLFSFKKTLTNIKIFYFQGLEKLIKKGNKLRGFKQLLDEP